MAADLGPEGSGGGNVIGLDLKPTADDGSKVDGGSDWGCRAVAVPGTASARGFIAISWWRVPGPGQPW